MAEEPEDTIEPTFYVDVRDAAGDVISESEDVPARDLPGLIKEYSERMARQEIDDAHNIWDVDGEIVIRPSMEWADQFKEMSAKAEKEGL